VFVIQKGFLPVIVSIVLFSLFSCDNASRSELINGLEKEEADNNSTPDETVEPVDDNEPVDDFESVDDIPQEECGNNNTGGEEKCDGNFIACSELLGESYEGDAEWKKDCSGFDISTCTEKVVSDGTYYVDPSRCNGCRNCIGSCSYGALSMSGFKAVIDPLKCNGCGDCVRRCPRGAIKKNE
jgi:NAD-dependent dihydropyrimidine dehydrogenase PreA subunit